MAIYYVDADSKFCGDGLSPETAVTSEEVLKLLPGDTVLFKCGTVMRRKLAVVSGTKDKPITYSSYGEGDKPEFCGSIDLTDKALWTEEKENIWVCNSKSFEACNFIFDDGKSFGTLRWSAEDMCQQGDFYDNCFECTEKGRPLSDDHKIYLYSICNPAEAYQSIECAVVYGRTLANNLPNVNFENLRFKNGGMHAIAGDARSENIKIHNCEFINIGGCVWSYERRIRFGNAVEFWDHAENIEITHCYFDNIYDSATSHQGGRNCEQGKSIRIEDNVFLRVGMGAYELRNRIPANSSFSNNICAYAGEGFSKNGEVMPRNSEIWPQPMGHHLFMWRVEEEKEGTFEVKNNIFDTAPYGAAIYSIINPECEKLVALESNTYYTKENTLALRMHGRDYLDFDEYAPLEKGCRHEKSDIDSMVCQWRKRS